MYYYKKTEKGIEKYKINYNENSLETLKKIVIARCCFTYAFGDFEVPKLVTLIDNILNENTTLINETIDEIFNPKERNKFSELLNAIKTKESELIKTPNDDIDRKIEISKDLKQLYNIYAFNKNQLPVNEFYEKVQKNLFFKLVDTLSNEQLEEYERVNNEYNSFFEKQKVKKIKRLGENNLQ